MKTLVRLSMLTIVAMATGGCEDPKEANRENLGAAVQAFLDQQHGACARLPAKGLSFTSANSNILDTPLRRQADALVSAGLLSRQDAQVEGVLGKEEPGVKYELTESGRSFLVESADTKRSASALCTGKLTLATVDNFTEPTPLGGLTISEVAYTYRLEDGASWAASPEILAVYKPLAALTDSAKEKATVMLTDNGWVHEKLFEKQ